MLKLLFGAIFVCGLAVSPAMSQPAKIFLASTGNDANDGGRATPKRSLQAGVTAVAAGGEVVILDTAGYGAVVITKSVGIVVPPGVNGFVTTTAPTATAININAAATDVITLRGLIVEGTGPTVGIGIQAETFGTLVVEDTTVQNFKEGLYVVSPVANRVLMRGGAVRKTMYGIDIESFTAGVKIDAILTDVEMSKNEYAFYTYAGANSTVHVAATRCAAIGNANVFFTQGLGGAAVADGCTIAGNGTVFGANTGGINYTGGNNRIFSNTALGTAPTAQPFQ